MKKFVIIGALALAACSGGEEAADEAMVEEPVVEEVVMAADGNPPEGTYEITSVDGAKLTQVVNPDGTYVNLNEDGEEINRGTWSVPDSSTWCSTEEGAEETCFAEEIDENGVWTSVNLNDPEDSSTVVRVE